jgi:hypothetical protein
MFDFAIDIQPPKKIKPINPNRLTDERRKRFRQQLIEGKDISIYLI